MFRFRFMFKKILATSLLGWLIRTIDNSTAAQRLRYRLYYYRILSLNLRKQLSSHTHRADRDSEGIRILLPLIETSHYQYLQILILAKALETRGAKIKVLICGQALDGCEIKSVKKEYDNDPCWRCRFNEVNILPLFNLEVLRLNDVLSKEEIKAIGDEAKHIVDSGECRITKYGVDLGQSITDSVIRYFYGAKPNDPKIVNSVRESHIKTALMTIEVAKRIDQTWRPQRVLSNMPTYSAWAPYYKYYHSRGNRFFQISITAFEYHSILLNSFELYLSQARFERYQKSRSSPILNQHERLRLQQFVTQRMTGMDAYFRQYNYFDKSKTDASVSRLAIDKTKRNIFLFSNIYWDIGLSDCAGLYQDVITWVLDSIELLMNEQSVHLYVKPHPAEVFDSSNSLKGVSQFIKDKYPQLPENLTIIEPEWKIKTYDLFPYIDVGVIFNGTLGLEMMLAGIPVISTGLTTHQGIGFALEPETKDAYHLALTGNIKPPVIDRDKLELFAYFYFIRTLIPWRLTKQAYDNADFDGYCIECLDDLEQGRDPYLDHLCNSILDPENTVIEAWPDEISSVKAV